MSRLIRRLLVIDHDKLDLRLAGYAVVGILLASAFEAIVGVGALQTGVAAVVVVVVGRTGDLRTRMVHMAAVTLIGGAFGFFSYISAETGWPRPGARRWRSRISPVAVVDCGPDRRGEG